MQVAFYLAGEITQVKESIPGVRCASGNVWLYIEHELAFKDVDELATHNKLVSGDFLALEDHMAD